MWLLNILASSGYLAGCCHQASVQLLGNYFSCAAFALSSLYLT
jgi:hypothetical protein